MADLHRGVFPGLVRLPGWLCVLAVVFYYSQFFYISVSFSKKADHEVGSRVGSLLDCGIAGLVDLLIAYSSVALTIGVRAAMPSVDRLIGLFDQHPLGRVLAPSSVHLMTARPICRFVPLIRPFMGFGLRDCDLACWCSGIVLRSTPNGPTDCAAVLFWVAAFMAGVQSVTSGQMRNSIILATERAIAPA